MTTNHVDTNDYQSSLEKSSFKDYVETQNTIQNKMNEALRTAIHIKLRNQKNKRTGAREVYDSSGNMILNDAYRRNFIINHLAKKKLMESMGRGYEMPTIAEIMKRN
jgi:hypothetical protein